MYSSSVTQLKQNRQIAATTVFDRIRIFSSHLYYVEEV